MQYWVGVQKAATPEAEAPKGVDEKTLKWKTNPFRGCCFTTWWASDLIIDIVTLSGFRWLLRCFNLSLYRGIAVQSTLTSEAGSGDGGTIESNGLLRPQGALDTL
eukprot:6027840-Amphidinium_carterae.1